MNIIKSANVQVVLVLNCSTTNRCIEMVYFVAPCVRARIGSGHMVWTRWSIWQWFPCWACMEWLVGVSGLVCFCFDLILLNRFRLFLVLQFRNIQFWNFLVFENVGLRDSLVRNVLVCLLLPIAAFPVCLFFYFLFLVVLIRSLSLFVCDLFVGCSRLVSWCMSIIG